MGGTRMNVVPTKRASASFAVSFAASAGTEGTKGPGIFTALGQSMSGVFSAVVRGLEARPTGAFADLDDDAYNEVVHGTGISPPGGEALLPTSPAAVPDASPETEESGDGDGDEDGDGDGDGDGDAASACDLPDPSQAVRNKAREFVSGQDAEWRDENSGLATIPLSTFSMMAMVSTRPTCVEARRRSCVALAILHEAQRAGVSTPACDTPAGSGPDAGPGAGAGAVAGAGAGAGAGTGTGAGAGAGDGKRPGAEAVTLGTVNSATFQTLCRLNRKCAVSASVPVPGGEPKTQTLRFRFRELFQMTASQLAKRGVTHASLQACSAVSDHLHEFRITPHAWTSTMKATPREVFAMQQQKKQQQRQTRV